MKISKLIACCLGMLLLVANTATAQETNATISGTLSDGTSGEELIGATIAIIELNEGTTTNVYGFYSLTVPKGEYTVEMSYIGYETVVKKLNLTSSETLDIELFPQSNELKEIVVTAEQQV